MRIVILLVVVGLQRLTNPATAIIVHEGSTIVHVLDAPMLFGVADEAVPIDRKESP